MIECCDALPYMRELDSESVDLVVTSPPYNIGKEYEKRADMSAYLAEQAEHITEAVRALRPSGSICWQVGNYVHDGRIIPLDAALFPVFDSLGLRMRNRIVWTFGHGLHCKNRFSGRHETIMWFTKTDNYTFNLDPVRVPSKYPGKKHFKGPKRGQLSGNPLGKNPSDVWDIPNVKSNHIEKTSHPCQYPVGLVERLVLALTNPGDLVLDPFMGSGTTAVACVRTGRSFVGCDRDKTYTETANERVALARAGRLRTREMNKPVYEPAAT